MSVEVKTIRSDIPGHQTHFSPSGLSAQEESRKLFVGRDIALSGEITSCDHLIVEGTVGAELRGSRRMDVLESGLFRGLAEVQEATIAGRFEGDLIVHGKLSIRSTGQITGNICYGAIEISAGAQIHGGIEAIPQPQPVHHQGYTHPSEESDAITANTGDEKTPQQTARIERLERFKAQPEIRSEVRSAVRVEFRAPKKTAA